MSDDRRAIEAAARGQVQPNATERPLTVHRRLRQIITVLIRNGFALELVRFGLESLVPFHRHLLRDTVGREGAMRPVQLRVALEQLGTTAIKLGQILSTRADLLPPAYIAELAKLRDQVPPVPAEVIRADVASSLGSPVDQLFAWFDDTPLAAASIGQVHAARLPTGEEVIVKVRKPGVAEQVEIDLRILLDLARIAERHSALARQYGVVALADEFAYILRDELDYEREGNNADTFRRQFLGNPDVVIPTVYWPLTTQRVLTEQRLTGIAIDDAAELTRRGVDLKSLAARSANLILIEVFEHGFYHADPHPGNFVVLDGGVIGAMDFGMVGRLPRGVRHVLLELLDAVVSEDAARTVDAFEALGIVGVEAAREALIRDVEHLFGRFLGRPLAEVRFADLAESIFALTRRYHLKMPAELVLLLKTLAMNEGVGRRLDPDFNAVGVAAPFVRRQMRQRIKPSFWEPVLRRGLLDLARMGVELPGDLRRMTRRVERGEFTVVTRLDGYEAPLRRLEAMVNRLAGSILVSALVLGTSMAVVFSDPSEHSPWFNGLLAAGMLVTFSLGVWLVISIWRSGRR
jgi:ubiquinone biosynthesis protein